MKLSVVIVNYNVVYYLEQCLFSVFKALKNIESEVFVVDNNSVDGSCAMVRRLFPTVILIENFTNLGFSKANNQAIAKARGEYILLLNPDTVVEEHSFQQMLSFMDKTPDAGGLGVKMIDGNGKFLPESKRAFPSPRVAFNKIFGLSRLFPRSRYFNRYHLGHLDTDQTHQVDVLSGACMMVRSSVLAQVGLLDEDFFMYGEDIDLSYRIVSHGYKNYYSPQTTIIHYKGQSTQKGSLNYVIVFYKAMKIFAKKHLSRNNARWFFLLINIAIYIRASLAICNRLVMKMFYPCMDFAVIMLGFLLITPHWAHFKYNDLSFDFPDVYYMYIAPLYTAVWVVSQYVMGSYLRPIDLQKTLRSLLVGTIINVVIFALLPDELRYSRAMLVFCTAWTCITTLVCRKILDSTGIATFKLKKKRLNRTLIVGDQDECQRVSALAIDAGNDVDICGFVSVDHSTNPFFTGSISQLDEISKIHRADEIIFCEKSIPEMVIISSMMKLSYRNLEMKIAPSHSFFIVGNNYINTTADLYSVSISSISTTYNRLQKRAFDIVMSLVLFLLSFVCVLFSRRFSPMITNCISVLRGKMTLVGYNNTIALAELGLPRLKPSIFPVATRAETENATIEKMNVMYAKNYSISRDFSSLTKGLKYLICKK